jgi:leader peptidase (prepilin peptidase)/N-methyltransferase
MWIYPVLFVLGLGIGVFINVLADNLPPDANDMRYPPRPPRCRACQVEHEPACWLALAALVARGGRCEHCGARRPARAWVVELAAGLGTALIWPWAIYRAGQQPEPPSTLLLALTYLAALWLFQTMLLVTVIDIEHRLILWNIVWPTALGVAWFGLLLPTHGALKTFLGGLAGYGATLAIFLLAELYSRVVHRLRGQPLDEVAFGGGDVNLAGIVGLAVGWPGIVLSLLVAVLAGGAFSLVYIVAQVARRRYTPHSAMPYGPFLVLGCLLIYFVGRDLSALWP